MKKAKIKENVFIPSEIMNMVKLHEFYTEEYRKAKDLKNFEMIEYYVGKMRDAENTVTFNLHKYISA